MNFFALCVSLLPLMLIVWIGATRVLDQWHHKGDVIAGWLLGLMCSYISLLSLSGHASSVEKCLGSKLTVSSPDVSDDNETNPLVKRLSMNS